MTSPERDDLTPEERRLAAHLAREQNHGGWPEHLRHSHPDLFPVHRYERERTQGKGLRRLLSVTLPVMALLLVAEATDSFIGNAWLLALLVGVAALCFWVGFLAPPWTVGGSRGVLFIVNRYYRLYAQAGFVVLLALVGVAGYFGWREHHTVDDLAGLITPVPQIESVTYIPSAAELEAMTAALTVVTEFNRALPRGRAHLAPEPWDLQSVRSAERERTYWNVETRLDTTQVMAFYDRAEHRLGWDVLGQAKGLRILTRGQEQLIIFARDDWPRPRIMVAYIYTPAR